MEKTEWGSGSMLPLGALPSANPPCHMHITTFSHMYMPGFTVCCDLSEQCGRLFVREK